MTILGLVLALLGLSRPASAVEIEFTARVVRREILALYDSRHEKEPGATRIHKFAEMPLNHLGYVVRFVDINGVLPEPSELGRYRGMISWFIEPLQRTSEYLRWLDAATATGIKFALFAELAPPETEQTRAIFNRVLKRIGLETTGEFVNITHKARITESDPRMVGFERPLDKALPAFAVLSPVSMETKVHLAVETPLRDSKVTAALVTTAPGGGYVSDEFAMVYDSNTDRVRWVLNPFRFFNAVFGDERHPVPDVTTLAGRRIYFSHIDGDGWNNVSEVEGYRQAQVLSSEVIAKEAIEAYPDLPVTVGLIGGDLDASLGGNPQAAGVARRIFALPQVEVASHTYTHPFDWGFFAAYDRQLEMEKIDTARRPDQSVWDNVRIAAMKLAGREPTTDRLNKYVAGSADLPRSYLRNPFDLDQEIAGGLAASERLAPPGKKAKIMLWSGDTMPFEAALRATRVAGVRNMNGGDTRLDPEYPSLFYVPPIARTVGRERQIYAGNSNENTYTNFWHGPYWGYLNLEKTLVNTEQPRRLKPFNVYYHMYMGEKPAALSALKHFLDLARASDVIPITASHYAGLADDFFSLAIEQVGPSAWAVTDRGSLQTVRFDDADLLDIDYAVSSGVLGAARANGSLYVTLDAAVARAVVGLQPKSDAAAGAARASAGRPIVTLVHSRWEFSERTEDGCGLRFKAQGFGPGQMQWRTDPDRALRMEIERGGVPVWQADARADASGLVNVVAPALAIEPLNVRIMCHD